MTNRTGLDALAYDASRNKVIRDAADRILSIAEELHANLIDALHVAIDCMECFTPLPESAVAMLRNVKQEVNE